MITDIEIEEEPWSIMVSIPHVPLESPHLQAILQGFNMDENLHLSCWSEVLGGGAPTPRGGSQQYKMGFFWPIEQHTQPKFSGAKRPKTAPSAPF